MRVTAEAAEEVHHLLVQHGVVRHAGFEIFQFRGRRQFPVEQQVAHFQEVRIFRQLVDRVAAVQQFALFTVDEGDRGIAACRGGIARIVGEHAGLTIKLADVEHIRPGRGRVDRQLVAVVTNGERRGFLGFAGKISHHCTSSEMPRRQDPGDTTQD